MPRLQTLQNKRDLSNPDYDFIYKESQLHFMVTRLEELEKFDGWLGVDTETSGLDPHRDRVELIQIASDDYCLIVDLNLFRKGEERQVNWDQAQAFPLKALLESRKTKVLQNAQFDLNFLRAEGVALGGSLFDTMLCARVLNNGSGWKNDLGSLVKRYLKVEIDKSNQKEDWTQRPLPEDMLQYAARDAICLPRMAPLIKQRLTEDGMWPTAKFELDCLRPIAAMSFNGLGFDRAAAQKLQVQLEEEKRIGRDALVALLDERMVARKQPGLPRDEDGSFNLRAKDSGAIRLGTKKYKGFNPDSPMQMADALMKAGVMLRPNEKGKYTVDQNLLALVRRDMKADGLKTDLIDTYLAWKESATLCKHIKTLLEAAGDRDRICASYRQLGTETGRCSCAGPNLQQVPRSQLFRSLFPARKGWTMVVADYSQVELRVAADLSQEPAMMDAINRGMDLHTTTACLMLNKDPNEIEKAERQSAKIANFGLLFGAGAATLLKQAIAQYGVEWTEQEAKTIVKQWHAAYPGLRQWQLETGERETKAIFTKSGRRRLCMTERSGKFTTRINTEVQGTAGDITKGALVRLWNYLRVYPGEALLVGTVHDEILLEVKDEFVDQWKERLVKAMENAGKALITSVPISAEVDAGPSWADAK
jgi:DNA polymerase I-like protein with 3'-5' exonuclease and polymerase domains